MHIFTVVWRSSGKMLSIISVEKFQSRSSVLSLYFGGCLEFGNENIIGSAIERREALETLI